MMLALITKKETTAMFCVSRNKVKRDGLSRLVPHYLLK
jgi:hypothetical protein